MCFVFAELKGASLTHACLAYVLWQEFYGKKPGQASQELGKVSGLQPLLEHSPFL